MIGRSSSSSAIGASSLNRTISSTLTAPELLYTRSRDLPTGGSPPSRNSWYDRPIDTTIRRAYKPRRIEPTLDGSTLSGMTDHHQHLSHTALIDVQAQTPPLALSLSRVGV